MSKTAKWLTAYVMTFSAIVALSACGSQPKQPEVGAVVVVPQAQPGPLPTIVQEVEPLPAGYFQRRRLERETQKRPAMKTPTSPTSSISHTRPAALTV